MLTAVYTNPTATISPSGGNVSAAQTVSLSSSKTGSIYYTIDGTTPSMSSTVYTGAFSVSSTATVKALAVDYAGNHSALASATYTFPSPAAPPSPTPSLSPSPSSSQSPSSVPTRSNPTSTSNSPAASPPTAPSPTADNQIVKTINTKTLIIKLRDEEGNPIANATLTLLDTN